jgi:hypothetical protein
MQGDEMTTENIKKSKARAYAKKTDEAPEPILLRLSDGTKVEVFNMKDSALYVGVTQNVLQRLLDKGSLTQYKTEIRPDAYLLKSDLDELMTAYPVDRNAGGKGKEDEE